MQDVDLYTLWAEETLIEDNLILDILFLAYYESFCTCDAKCWKKLFELYKVTFIALVTIQEHILLFLIFRSNLQEIINGSYNFHKLSISAEAVKAIYHAKVQLLLILIEALNLENLLQMVGDNIPFRLVTLIYS